MPTVTLANAGQPYNLLSLLYGPGGAIGNISSQGRENAAELTLRSDPGNAASKIYAGDGSVSPTNFDVGPLNPGDVYTYGPAVANTISLVNKFLRTDTPGVKVDVMATYA